MSSTPPTATPAVAAIRRPEPLQYAALRTGCALVSPAAHTLLRMSGEDRARFLQGLVTCDVEALAPGAGVWGFFTTLKGRILADVAVLANDGVLWLRVPAGEAEAVREHALKYRIADRVEIEPVPDRVALTLAGPGAAAVLAAALAADGAGEGGADLPAEPWTSAAIAVGGVPVLAVREGLLGVDGYTLWIDRSAANELEAGLRDRHPDLVSAEEAAVEAVRIEAGIPRFGRDYGDGHFPQETGLGDQAVSYTKGCYLGQEIVARIHYRGGVQRAPAGLHLAADLIDAGLRPGTPLLHEGREAGRLTSFSYSPARERWVGLSILHNRASAPGTGLSLEGFEDRAPAEVTELPFVS